jgi:hypothetical protein
MTIKPQNLEEKLVWYTIIGTYGLYFIGAQFVWIPALAFFLLFRVAQKLWEQTPDTPAEERITVPVSVWIWAIAMILMEIALVMAHIDRDLGIPKMVFTTVNSWARTWALMGIFPLVGCLKIRTELLARAACILCVQSLVLAIVCSFMFLLGIPDPAYISPLVKFRGASTNYLVDLYDVGGDFGEARQFRLKLFTNFANSLGVVGNVYFFIATLERNRKWRLWGMVGGAAMVIGSGSRSTLVCLPLVPITIWFLTNFGWPIQIAAGVLSTIAGMIAPQLIELFETIWDKAVKGYRGNSELVRRRLAEVTMNRWIERPIWGHGYVEEKGPKYTEHMPIGTHNQWPDLLYVRGMVGFIAFSFAMLWSFVDLTIKAQKSTIARVGLSVLLVLLIATTAIDIENTAYLYWPGLVMMGIAFKESVPAAVDNTTLSRDRQIV